jgi:hypothetical protein
MNSYPTIADGTQALENTLGVVSYKIQKKVQKLWGPWLLLVFLL